VYLLTSLLDDKAVQLALGWRASGHRVIVIDVLPTARFARTTRAERIAHRIVMMERDDRIRTITTHGVEMLRWAEDDTTVSRQARLQLLSRRARDARGKRGRR
jgi:hypothetical protein